MLVLHTSKTVHVPIDLQQLIFISSNSVALKTITLKVRPGQDLVICGRTGSGKSTLLSTLLRTISISAGSITIDDLPLITVPLNTLRQRLITIPQDFIHLPGTVRLNADPLHLSSDSDIEEALVMVNLRSAIESQGGLDAEFRSENLSQGQQQLFALARAIVQKRAQGTSVLLLDEAMSSIDAETEKVMREVLRKEFEDSTVVNVTHKVDTILDADVVAVMDAGEIVEFGEPGQLMERNGGRLRTLLRGNGRG
jgi:ATP-binding cassette subfamily C (CFTR/MRP) protein 1